MNTTTTYRRRVSGLISIGAIGLLAAGCSAGAGTADAEAGGAGGAADPAAAQVQGAAGSSDASSAHETPSTRATGHGSSDAFTLPDGWPGTLVAEPGVLDGSEYVTIENNYGGDQPAEVSGERIAGGEFFGGTDATCEGVAVLNGAAATCTFTAVDDPGTELRAAVRLAPTGFGNTGLVYRVTKGSDPSFTLPADVPIATQSLGVVDPSAVTQSDVDEAAISAVMMGSAADGDLPTGLKATCDLADHGMHALCEVSGTPDGGGDGTWYATAHRGYDGENLSYVFAELPQD